MRMTQHAKARQQKRGIEDRLLEMVLDHGVEFKASDHAAMFRISKKELRFLESECPRPLWRRYRDSLNKTVPVVSKEGLILTAMQRYRKIRRVK